MSRADLHDPSPASKEGSVSTPADLRRAALAVCSRSDSVEEARDFLGMFGLIDTGTDERCGIVACRTPGRHLHEGR